MVFFRGTVAKATLTTQQKPSTVFVQSVSILGWICWTLKKTQKLWSVLSQLGDNNFWRSQIVGPELAVQHWESGQESGYLFLFWVASNFPALFDSRINKFCFVIERSALDLCFTLDDQMSKNSAWIFLVTELCKHFWITILAWLW